MFHLFVSLNNNSLFIQNKETSGVLIFYVLLLSNLILSILSIDFGGCVSYHHYSLIVVLNVTGTLVVLIPAESYQIV